MYGPIEFYGTPDACAIELNFSNGRTKHYRCRVDISEGNTVSEVYDKDDEVIATTLQELLDMGVVSASVKATHQIELEI